MKRCALVSVLALIVSQPLFGAIAIDTTISRDQGTASATVSTPAFSTTSNNELLLAFISADNISSPNATVTKVTGAGLTWVLVQRTNVQPGTAEIWRAFSTAPLSAVTVTATLSQRVVSSITVMGFSGVNTSGVNGSGAIGAVGTGNGNPGAPTAALVTTGNGSLVLGVGNDWDNAITRTPATGQTVVHQYLPPVGDTYWVQMRSSPIPLSGTGVTINDSVPTSDRYDLSVVEVLAAAGGGTTGTITGTINQQGTIGGATVQLLQGSTQIASATVGTNGSYTFSNVANGTYTLQPSESGFTFTPTTQIATVNGNTVTVPVFTATATATTGTINGSISQTGPISGATVQLLQGSTQIATASVGTNGSYSFSSVANGTYTLQPGESGFTFSPTMQNVTVIGNIVTAQTFTATAGGVLIHVGGASGHPVVTNQKMTFNYTPVGTNDALTILVGCISPGVTGMSLTAPGWTFTPISGLIGPSSISDFISTFGAITPSSDPITITVTLTGGNGNCSGDASVLVDEFSGNDITGGTTTFDAHNESLDNTVSTGTCTGAPVTPANNNDAIWYACYDNVTGVGGGYLKGQDDGIGDWTEYRLLSGGSGVVQNPSFVTNPSFTSFGMGGVSIKPASLVPDLTISKTHAGGFVQGQIGAIYKITVANSGGAATSGTVTVNDALPAALFPTAIGGPGWTCTLATLTCTRTDALAAVSNYPAITLTVNIASNAPASVTNAATVAGGGETNSSNDTANDITTIAPLNVSNIKLVQLSSTGNEATGTSVSINFPSGNTAGDFLIVTGTAARPASTIVISDTTGNTYLPAFGPVTDATQNVTAYIWYVPTCKGGPNTVTITPATASALEIHISEWSGLATVSPVDQIASATGTGTVASSGPQSTTVNGELVFGYGWVLNTAAAGSGFTSLSLVNGDLDEYLVQPVAGSVAATFTQTNGTWFAMMVTFKPATGSTSGYTISGTINPASAGIGATVTLSGASAVTAITDSWGNYSFGGLTSGNYTITPSNPGYVFTPSSQPVTISSANVPGVNFTASAPPAILSVVPTGVSFVGNQGGSNPAPSMVSVTNTGGGTLNFNVASDSTWLAVSPASGSAPQQLQLSANISSLALGTYFGHVTITSTGAQGSPALVNVTLTIGVATDWLTVDHDSSRSGNAVDETTLTTANAGSLQLSWSTKVDGSVTAQPLYVHAIQIAGQTRDVLIVATGGNSIYALDAGNGSVLWNRNFGAPTPNTWGLPDGFGIEGPPYIDRVAGCIYTVSTDGSFRTVSLFDGTDVYPALALIANPVTNKVWGGLNRVGNSIYVADASNGGDVAPWRGEVYQIDVSATPKLAGSFVVVPSIPAPNGGGGIWGYGGVSADLATGNVYASTAFDSNVSGNGNENTALYSNSMIALNSGLSLLGYFQGPQPSTISCSAAPCDLDFASTPTLFQPTGCPTMTAAGSKNGNLYLFRTVDLIASGQPLQILSMNAPNDSLGSGGVGGVPAWSAANNMLYITDAGPGVTGIAGGVVGLKVTSNCMLQVAWSNALGGNDNPNSTPTIANGIVFVGQGNSGVIHAYDSLTGTPLWQSGSTYGAAATFAAPIVAGGNLYVGSWASFSGGGIVGAFSLPTKGPVLSVSPQTLSFSATSGGSNPSPAMINITNSGTGTLSFTAGSDSSWLIVSPISGNAPQPIQASTSIAGLVKGTYTGHITVIATGGLGSPAVVTVTLTIGATPNPLAIDAKIFKDNGSASSSITCPVFSTIAGNELLLALISTDYNTGANTTVTGVTGGGLTWALVARTNAQSGSSEIWRAFAASSLSNVTVTATLSQSVVSSMTVMSFTGVDNTGTNGSGAIGATKSTNAPSGAPTATLVTTRNNSWVIGVGNDYDNAISRTVGASQTLVHQFLTPTGDTYWTQMQNGPTPISGTSVTINDTAPSGDRYNLTICEILPIP